MNGPNIRQRFLRILLVEDHDDTRDVLALFLRARGHDVTSASTLAQSLDLLEEGSFDLLITDIGLPDGDGRELLRRAGAAAPAHAIAVSGFGTLADQLASREAGFMAHLVKPPTLREIDRLLRDVTMDLSTR